MSGEKKKTKVFLLLGLLVFALIATYKVVFFASYLNVDQDEVVFEWTGGELDVRVNTDANSWIVENGEYVGWATFQKRGDYLHVYVEQNNSDEDRNDFITIRSGYIGGLGSTRAGLGNKSVWLRVAQNGKTENVVYEHSNEPEMFAEFWKSFCNDPAFQKSRIKFPLVLTYYEENFDDWGSVTEKTDYLYATDWHFDDFKDTPEYQILIDKKDGAYCVIQAGRECGIHVEYYFKSDNGKWYLVRVEDISN